MNKPHVLVELARRLEAAATAGDWKAVRRAQADVAAALAGASARGGASGAERQAFERLRAAHDAALARCTDAAGELRARMDDMSRHREGWIAYALQGQGEAGA
jgi:hypothetical protein